MFFLLIYLATIRCSDYIWFIPNDDTKITAYVSLRSIDKNIKSSLLTHRLGFFISAKKISNYCFYTNFFEYGSLCYFEPVNDDVYHKIPKMLESVHFKYNKDLENAISFYNNRFMLKTTITLKKDKESWFELLFLSRNKSNIKFKRSNHYISKNRFSIQEIKWGSYECKHKPEGIKCCDELYKRSKFKHADFYVAEELKTLKFRSTEESVREKLRLNDIRNKRFKFFSNNDNATETTDIIVEDIKNQEEQGKLNAQIIKNYIPNGKQSVDNCNFLTNMEEDLHNKTLDKVSDLHLNKDNFFNLNC
ncbi:uncharacterized protein VNE69_02057 [Vairimorpha necatrix]|uniref:Uncharacterized protein n=1 Tax=Vairimorpha necatrix TaxID=6039 RepID=A0AAX4J9B5_9MICR